MKILVLLLGAFLVCRVVAATTPPQRIDPAFFGVWKLNVAKSEFGSKAKPKSGLMNWTRSGWVSSIVNADDSLYTEAVFAEKGCALIGVPDTQWCTIKVASPRHIYFSIHEVCDPLRGADIELLDKNTVQATHQVFSEHGSSLTGKEIWERQVPKQRNEP